MNALLNRPTYLAKLRGFKNIQLVKAVTGVRRCGKSTLLKLFQSELKKDGVSPEQILEINLENADNSHLLDWKILHDHIKEHLLPDRMNYIFLDEIQQVEDFPKTINSLRLLEHVDLYVTGSNAYMFSGKIMTLLGGRYVEIKMLPLSFAEYMQAFPEADPARKYKDYLEQSSFPQTLEFQGNKQLIHDYLDGIYNTIVRRDVLLRKGMKDSSQFESIARFLFDNIGSEVSVNKIFNTLHNELKTPVQPPVINEYLDALVESYIFYKVPRWDIKGRKFLKTNAKYYAVDIGLRFALLGKEGSDSGHILENIVFLELLRRGYKVSAGSMAGAEVDFFAERNGLVEYYQVSLNTSAYEREIRSLDMIKDHNQKTLIVMEHTPTAAINGIVIQNAHEWLLQG